MLPLLLEREEDHHLQNLTRVLEQLIKVHLLKVQSKLRNQKILKCLLVYFVTFVDENMEQPPLKSM